VFAIKKKHFGQLHAATPCKAYTFFLADDALLGANASEIDARHVPQRENAVAGPKLAGTAIAVRFTALPADAFN
jgi:hypothetical protein